jgi:hypothetical protein
MMTPSTKDLPGSGTIKLSEIKTEFGKGNNLLSYLGEGGVTSSAPLKLTDFYGTGASDAVSSETFGNGWVAAFKATNNTLSFTDKASGTPSGYPHKWPLSKQDNLQHALISPYTPVVTQDSAIIKAYPSWGRSFARHFGYSPRMQVNQYGSASDKATTYGVHPCQRLKPGPHTFNGWYEAENSGHDGTSYSVECSILEYETMTAGSDGFATAGGRYRRTVLASKSASTIGVIPQKSFAIKITTTYEWVFFEIKAETRHDRGTIADACLTSITSTRAQQTAVELAEKIKSKPAEMSE